MTKKENLEEYPVLTRADCPNILFRLINEKQKLRDIAISEQIHDYHMEMLSVKQTVVNHTLFLRLGVVALLIIMVLALTSC